MRAARRPTQAVACHSYAQPQAVPRQPTPRMGFKRRNRLTASTQAESRTRSDRLATSSCRESSTSVYVRQAVDVGEDSALQRAPPRSHRQPSTSARAHHHLPPSSRRSRPTHRQPRSACASTTERGQMNTGVAGADRPSRPTRSSRTGDLDHQGVGAANGEADKCAHADAACGRATEESCECMRMLLVVPLHLHPLLFLVVIAGGEAADRAGGGHLIAVASYRRAAPAAATAAARASMRLTQCKKGSGGSSSSHPFGLCSVAARFGVGVLVAASSSLVLFYESLRPARVLMKAVPVARVSGTSLARRVGSRSWNRGVSQPQTGLECCCCCWRHMHAN